MSAALLTVEEKDVLRVLVADDAATNRLYARRVVESLGHVVVTAASGREAIEVSRQQSVDLVLMDAVMPDIDGYSAARVIKAEAGDRFVPIVFVSAADAEESRDRSVEAGGDDFVSKPLLRDVLRAKIASMRRIAGLNRRLREQRDRLHAHEQMLLREQAMAADALSRIVRSAQPRPDHVSVHLSPRALFNGDLVLVETSPNGRHVVLVGDFTGHGLSAAIGAIPVAQIFFAMAGKGASIREIAAEIDQRLCRYLPAGVFFAAALATWDLATGKLDALNSGLPDLFLRHQASGSVERVVSDQPPLGIRGLERRFDVHSYALEAADTLYLYTDGVTETVGPGGEPFGDANLLACLPAASMARDPSAHVAHTLQAFRQDHESEDDVTVVSVRIPHGVVARPSTTPEVRASSHFRVDLTVSGPQLRELDPILSIMNMLESCAALGPHLVDLQLILAELVTNALDYGLLELPNHLKHSPASYGEYLQLRSARLAALQRGHVHVLVEYLPVDAGGRLKMVVSDTGPGFDTLALPPQLLANEGTSRRGIPLVRELCRSVHYSDRGRTVEAVYEWRTEA